MVASTRMPELRDTVSLVLLWSITNPSAPQKPPMSKNKAQIIPSYDTFGLPALKMPGSETLEHRPL